MLDQTKFNDKIDEEIVEEVVEEVKPVVVKEKKAIVIEETENPGFINSLAANLFDAAVIGIAAFLLLYVVDFIMKNTIGLYVADKSQMTLLLYIIVSVVYFSIVERKLGSTFGKKMFGIKVSKN